MSETAITVTPRGQSKPPADLAQFIELVNADRLFEQQLPDLFPVFFNAEFELDAERYRAMSERELAMVERRLFIEQCEVLLPSFRSERAHTLGRLREPSSTKSTNY